MTWIREGVSTRMPGPEESRLPRPRPGVPVLDVWHTSIDQDGQPYELTRFVMRGDMTRPAVRRARRLAVTRSALPRWQAAGLIVGFAGAVLIFTPWHTAGGLFSAGSLECLAASVSYAVSYIYMDRFLARRVSRRSCCPPASLPLPLSCSRSPWPLPALRRRSHHRGCRGDRGAGDRRDRVRVRPELPDHHQRGE